MRWTHWVNFPVLSIMIWSGMLIYWANDEYAITFGSHNLYKFFPPGFYEAYGIAFRLSEGMALHFFFMWLFMLNGLLYVCYTVISGEWRQLLPNRHSFKEAWLVLLHDLRLRQMMPPQDKYNAAQRIAYTAIVVMGFGSLVTGLAIYKPVQFWWLAKICGGYHLARIEHFALTVGYVVFFVIHIVQVVLAGWRNFAPVISGFEVVELALAGQTAQTESQAEVQPIRHDPGVRVISSQPISQDPGVRIITNQSLNRRRFLSFAAFLGVGFATFKAWGWLNGLPVERKGITAGAKPLLRRAMEQNEQIFRETFSNDHLVQTYPKSMAAKQVRVNSSIGLRDPGFRVADWSLNVTRADGSVLQVSMSELLTLPKTEIVYDFKCVEGWDQIQWWGGVKFSDFIEHYGLQNEAKLGYVGLATPNEQYYVGLERAAAMHPQTILAYQVNGQFLPPQHGQPLRLIIPVKYGIKNLKRIGSIRFSDYRPRDYWAEHGYDYYSGL